MQSWQHAGWDAWCNTITVCPEQTYRLSADEFGISKVHRFWIGPLMEYNRACGCKLDPKGRGPPLPIPGPARPVKRVPTSVCASPVGMGSEMISAWTRSASAAPSYFVMKSQLLVTPLPVVDLGPDTTLCAGQGRAPMPAVPGVGPTFGRTAVRRAVSWFPELAPIP